MPDRRMFPRFCAIFLVTIVAVFTGCGYRVSNGVPRGLPANVQSLAILPLENETLGFRIEQSLTSAVHQAFLTRSPYRVQSEAAGSDAVLRGAVTAFYTSPVAFDPRSGRTTEVLLTVGMRLALTDARSGATLFETSDWIFREPYEVSQDPAVYFGENQPAMYRLSRRMASSLVTMIMEGVE